MRTLAIIHHEIAGVGVFQDVVRARGHQLEYWTPSEQELPRPLAAYGAVFGFGGGMNPDEDDLHPWLLTVLHTLKECLSLGIPTLGVCLGGQLLARAAGASIGRARRPEAGWLPVEITDAGAADPLFIGLPRSIEVFQWHTYEFGVPPGGVLLACSEVSAQCIRVGDSAWGLQWHPEVLAESIFHWADRHAIFPPGQPGHIRPEELRRQVAERIEATNASGRDLCGRFLRVAEARLTEGD